LFLFCFTLLSKESIDFLAQVVDPITYIKVDHITYAIEDVATKCMLEIAQVMVALKK
jgi:hypothetical protein